MLDKAEIPIEDLLCTVTDYIVAQIDNTIQMLIDKYEVTRNLRLLATGGGALNTYLVERLTEKLSLLGVEVIIPERNFIEYKEAALLALIGLCQLHQLPNSIPSVTQATFPPVGGVTHLIRK